MTGLGERLWEIGKSPPQHLSLLVFGLVALLAGLIAGSLIPVAGAGAVAALTLAATVVLGVGAFFVALALFLGAYVSAGDSPTAVAWRIVQLIAAVLVLLVFF